MQGALTTPITKPAGASVQLVSLSYDFRTQQLAVALQILDSGGNVIDTQNLRLSAAAAAGFETWVKANAPGPIGTALGTPITSLG